MKGKSSSPGVFKQVESGLVGARQVKLPCAFKPHAGSRHVTEVRGLLSLLLLGRKHVVRSVIDDVPPARRERGQDFANERGGIVHYMRPFRAPWVMQSNILSLER